MEAKALRAGIELLNQQITELTAQRAEMVRQLHQLEPPPPIKPSVNTPAQTAANQRIIAETKAMIANRPAPSSIQ